MNNTITDTMTDIVTTPCGASNDFKHIPTKIMRSFPLAVESALNSDVKKSRHGAVIIYKGDVIGIGFNFYNNLPTDIHNYGYEIHGSRTTHAEIMAIYDVHRKGYNCRKILPKCSILVIRIPVSSSDPDEISFDDCNLSYPCKTCLHVLDRWGLNKIYCS